MSFQYTDDYADNDYGDYDIYEDYADSFDKSYYGAAKLPSGAGKQMYTNRSTRIKVSAIDKKPPKAKAEKNLKK